MITMAILLLANIRSNRNNQVVSARIS
jgi:hypothetical protein